MTFNNGVLGLALAIVFVTILVLRLRNGLAAANNHLAWSVALVAWWAAVAYARGLASTDTARYSFIGAAFIVLALLPVHRQTRTPWTDKGIATIACLVVAALVVLANHGDIFRNARNLERSDNRVRMTLIVAGLGPNVVPDTIIIPVGGYASMSGREYRDLIAQFGAPPGTFPKQPDRALINLGNIRISTRGRVPSGDCVALAGSSKIAPTAPDSSGRASDSAVVVSMRASDSAVVVRVRRFGNEWISIGRIPASSAATLTLPTLQSAIPWYISAPGACRVVFTATTIASPKGSTLSGVVPLFATVSSNVVRVEFRLTNSRHANIIVGPATETRYGWLYNWNSAMVPNGVYTLTSVVIDDTQQPTASPSTKISVDN